jgi:hypothetical protein
MPADFAIMGAQFNLTFLSALLLPTGIAVISTAVMHAQPAIRSAQ